MKLNKSEHAIFMYKKAYKECKEAYKKSYISELDNICKQNNTKSFFNFINKKIGREKTPIMLKDLKSNSQLTNSEAAEIFAFYHSTYSVDNGKLPELQQAGAFNLIDDDIIFDVDKIKLLLNKLPNKYSAGPDGGIRTILLKKLSNSLCLPLSLIFQNSFNNSDQRDDWKRANVVPVFKGIDNKYDVNNYRSISLTSTISKVMETMIHNHITEHCKKFKLLHSA